MHIVVNSKMMIAETGHMNRRTTYQAYSLVGTEKNAQILLSPNISVLQ